MTVGQESLPCFDTICQLAQVELSNMLNGPERSESAYQSFFELHPYLLSHLCSGIGGGGVIYNCLISQPRLDDIYPRVPDYVWLTLDSKYFRPIFIEIEKPGKKYFKQNGEFTAEFLQAFGQLCCWKSIMADSVAVQSFLKRFNLTEKVATKTTKPEYALLYGRRNEYLRNQAKCKMIASLENKPSFSIRPYDDLFDKTPSELNHGAYVVTCKQQQDRLAVVAVPSSFGVNKRNADDYRTWSGFDEALDKNPFINPMRKSYLKEKYREAQAINNSSNETIDPRRIQPNSWL